MMVPRGKMLGGSSGINYMVYVRGHPGDFDSWAAGGATGWSYDEVLPYFRKSEGLAPSGDIVVDADAHNTDGPLGCFGPRAGAAGGAASSSRRRWPPASRAATTTAATAAARPASSRCMQTTTRRGKRSSTYHAFLEGEAERRPNLDDHHRRAGDAGGTRRRGRTADRQGRRISHRRGRDRDRRTPTRKWF